MAKPLSLVFDPRCLLHLAHTHDNIWHPDHQKEQPGRVAGIISRLASGGLLDRQDVIIKRAVKPAPVEALLRAHTAEHLRKLAGKDTRLQMNDASTSLQLDDLASALSDAGLDAALAATLMGDSRLLADVGNTAPGYEFQESKSVYSCDYTPAVAALAAGGVMAAVDSVASGEARASFAIIRPPGHHCSDHGEGGFCWLNNVAVAVRHAQAAHRANRIAVLDWDIHHVSALFLSPLGGIYSVFISCVLFPSEVPLRYCDVRCFRAAHHLCPSLAGRRHAGHLRGRPLSSVHLHPPLHAPGGVRVLPGHRQLGRRRTHWRSRRCCSDW